MLFRKRESLSLIRFDVIIVFCCDSISVCKPSVYLDRVYINSIFCVAVEHIFPFAIYNLNNNTLTYLCSRVFARAIGKGKYYC